VLAQPPAVERHLAWLGALCAYGLAASLASSHVAMRVAAAVIACVGLVCGARAAVERRSVAPAATQVARFVASHEGALFAGRSARAAEVAGVRAYEARYLGEVRATLERLPRLPRRVWVTDEVLEPAQVNVERETSLCGPRSARGEPRCVRVRPYFPRGREDNGSLRAIP
jgi:hypothetical protein